MTVPRSRKGEETTALNATRHTGVRPGPETHLQVHVVREGRVETYPLVPGKPTVVGRTTTADIRLDEASVSRRHLAIQVDGEAITLRDLGSANGVRVGSTHLQSGQSTLVSPGVVVEIGTALLIVQWAEKKQAPRRVWSHGQFEGRLEGECNRSALVGGTFGVLRVNLADPSREPRARDLLSQALRTADVLAASGPGDLEALLVDTGDTGPLERAVASAFAADGIAFTSGVAMYPRDGRTPALLLSVADERSRPARLVAAGKRPVFGEHLAELEGVLRRIAPSNIHVLVTGETGTGKEVVAEMIHELSPRAKKPLVRVNCGAFTETLLAAELFGHERGAFTGADRAKEGLIESARGGTLFLDEVGELPLALQPKLLRVLEDGEVLRVGAVRPTYVDVRIVSATHRDLDAESAAGRFRPDLYYRLAGFTVAIRPLRERPADIVAIAHGLVESMASAAGVPRPTLDEGALAILTSYGWPGNVRELRNVIQRAMLLMDGGRIGPEHLPLEKLAARSVAAPGKPVNESAPALRTTLQAHERERIEEALREHGGNQTHAARALGISRGTLLARMDAFQLTRPRKRLPNP